ncbi:MAG: class I mannose-6-phosphate isomerase [Sphingomicrobium sp.]
MTRFTTRLVEKPWGRRGIGPRFGADPARQIGEIWFEPPPGEPSDILAKYLFTTERLSIQVHPDEATAHARGLPHGKDECWIVLDAAPGAEIGIGTREPISPDDLLAAARDGTIERHIDWRPAHRGQFIYNPAGSVHALGPGLTLLEIQQSFDVTYRLFDYGRPRPLHLTESLDVVDPRPHRHPADRDIDEAASAILVNGPYFGVAWCYREPPPLPPGAQSIQLLPIDAAVETGAELAAPGECHSVDGDPAGLRSDGAFVLAWSVAASA